MLYDLSMMAFLLGNYMNNFRFCVLQHPISRWIARYFFDPPEKDYEKHMALLDIEAKKTDLRYVVLLGCF